jgi:hypothetical protein
MSYMVSPIRIAEMAKKTMRNEDDFRNILEFGSSCYDAGVTEVLRIVVAKYGRDYVSPSKQTKQQELIVQQKKDELMKRLDEETKQLFEEYDEAFRDLMHFEADDHLTEGFIRGYRFLKNYIIFEDNGEEA